MTVEELLKKQKISYKVSGRDFLVSCLNPNHADDSPSMRIDKVLGIFHCLSCGHKGNLFYLYGEQEDKRTKATELIYRRIADIRIASTGLQIPTNSCPVERPFRVSQETLAEFEAFECASTEYLGRMMFPIRSIRGTIVAFHGRAEDPFVTPKYKTYPKGATLPLFPLHKSKPEQGRYLIVEGIFDLLNLWDNGFRNVICCFGAGNISSSKLQVLKMAGADGIDICFDPDDPGQEAAERLKELAEDSFLKVRNINLKNVDPGELPPTRATKLREKLYG